MKKFTLKIKNSIMGRLFLVLITLSISNILAYSMPVSWEIGKAMILQSECFQADDTIVIAPANANYAFQTQITTYNMDRGDIEWIFEQAGEDGSYYIRNSAYTSGPRYLSVGLIDEMNAMNAGNIKIYLSEEENELSAWKVRIDNADSTKINIYMEGVLGISGRVWLAFNSGDNSVVISSKMGVLDEIGENGATVADSNPETLISLRSGLVETQPYKALFCEEQDVIKLETKSPVVGYDFFVTGDGLSEAEIISDTEIGLKVVNSYFVGRLKELENYTLTAAYDGCETEVPMILQPVSSVSLWAGFDDSDWNNADNWISVKMLNPWDDEAREDEKVIDIAKRTDLESQMIAGVPIGCTHVIIPGAFPADDIPEGKSYHYPNLSVGGEEAVCNHITFKYGSMLGNQHLLRYNRAYVQYNFGYYKEDRYVAGDTLIRYGDPYSKPAMQRDQFYAMGVPLTSVHTGDFTFGGYPYTYYRYFNLLPASGGDLELFAEGSYCLPFASYAEELDWKGFGLLVNSNKKTRTLYGMSLRSAITEGLHGMGQRNLNNSKGIFQLPYFDHPHEDHRENFENGVNNEREKGLHGLHIYDSEARESRFHYMLASHKDAPRVHAYSPDVVQRTEEASRLKIDHDDQVLEYSGVDFGINEGQGTLFSNPFMAYLDMNEFMEENSGETWYRTCIDGSVKTFDKKEDGEWVCNDLEEKGGYIDPLKGFIFKPKNSHVVFYADMATVEKNQNLSNGNIIQDELYIKVKNVHGQGSTLLIKGDHFSNGYDKSEDINFMAYVDDVENKVPQIYTIAGDMPCTFNRVSNVFEQTIPIGIYCKKKNENTTLSFPNLLNFNVESIYLEDRTLGITQDLLENNEYAFFNENGDETSRFFITFVPSAFSKIRIDEESGNDVSVGIGENRENKLDIFVLNKNISVLSSLPIQTITVNDVAGKLMYKKDDVGATKYDIISSFVPGVYIVTAVSEQTTLTKKVIIK